jgi:hypothetical protein
MPAENVIERAFSGGEIAPALYARVDQSKYQTGLKTLRNHICMRLGGVTQRPGTMFVDQNIGLTGAAQTWLIPFIYNETGLGQSYILAFVPGAIFFYQNGAAVVSGSTPYSIASPYQFGDIPNIQFAQSADVLTLVHPSYAPRELRRLAPTNWTLTVLQNWGSNLDWSAALTATGTAGTPSPWAFYQVTSVDAFGQETDTQGGIANVPSFNANALNLATSTAPVTLSWNMNPNAVSYRIYKQFINAIGQITYGGFIGSTIANSFVDSGFTPDFTNTFPIYTQLFDTDDRPGNNPSTVGFVQQRRAFGATDNNPVGFWISQSGLFSNFDYHLTGIDSDAIFGSLVGDEVNAIQHILELKFMLMLTAGAEIYVQGNGQGVVTPSAVNASTQSQYGASPLRPLKVGDVILFNQALGSFIRDFVFDFVIDGYRGNDITVFSAHLFENYQIGSWAYQKVPDSIIWAARSDGVLLSCTYVREQQILAWAHHDLNGGFVESVAAIPENGEYAVYAVVRRQLSNGTNRYIERISSRIWQGPSGAVAAGTANAMGDPIDATYLDCFSKYDGRNTGAMTMTLTSNLTVITAGVNDGIEFGSGNASYTPILAVIPPGIYTATALAVAIQAALAAADPIGSYTVSLVAGVIVFSTTNPSFAYKLYFDPAYPNFSRSAGVTIGFPNISDYLVNFSNPQTANNPPTGAGFPSGSTAYQQQLILESSTSYFGNVAQVGDSIFLEDSEWISSQGISGNQLRCSIQSITSNTAAVVTPSGIVPTEFQNIATTLWARAVKTLSGLTQLIGQQVSVWADRYVVGSPLNLRYMSYTVPVSGILTLDKPYSVIYIGLPMTADFETLQIDTSFGDSIQGERKAISRLTVYLYNSRGFYGGTQNPDYDPDNLINGVVQDPLFNLVEEKQQENRQTYDAPPSLMTEWQSTNINVNWAKEGRIFIRNVDPIPLSILSVVPAGLTSAKVAWSQKV